MSITPSVANVKVAGSMVAKPVNIRVGATWKAVKNVVAELYVTPGSGSYSIGNTVTVVLRENSFTTAVNSLQVNLTYPAGILQFVSSDVTGTPFDTPAFQNTNASGTVSITLLSLGGTITGDQLVSTLTFTVIAAGSATIAFAAGSGIARASDSTAILNQSLSGFYTTT
jgi:hypothetical protein